MRAIQLFFTPSRSGYYGSALKLAQAADIADLTNIKLFLVAKDVEESLMERDTSACLNWCHDNETEWLTDLGKSSVAELCALREDESKTQRPA